MMYWLDTLETIPAGVGFSQFGICHLLWLTAFMIFTLGCCLGYRRLPEHGRKKLRVAIAAALAADELFKMAVLFIGGNYLPKYLPLHLCSVNILLIIWHAFRPNKTLDNFLYATCIPGALMALLFPNWAALPPANLMHIHSFTVHILLVAYPVMLLAGGSIRPDVKYLPKCLALLAGLVGVALVFNLIFGTNFMFLMSAEEGNPLCWFRDNWGSHLLGFPVLLPAVLLVMYAPVVLHQKRVTK